MGTRPEVGLGQFYLLVWSSKKDVVRGDFTVAQLSRFELGQSMLAADKLIVAVEGINISS